MATSFSEGNKVRWVGDGSCVSLNSLRGRIAYLVIDSLYSRNPNKYRYTAYDSDGSQIGRCSLCLGDADFVSYTSTVSTHELKVGDRIRLKTGYHTLSTHREHVITEIDTHTDRLWSKFDGEDSSDPRGTYCSHIDFECMELVSPLQNKKSLMSRIIEKFKVLTASEPNKTFIKAGIMDSNGVMNSDGRELFYEFMISKFGNEFKTEVVDKILAEDEKKSC